MESSAAGPGPAQSAASAPRRILIVDDDPGQLRLLERILTMLGYTVVIAPSGREALEVLADQRIDLVCTDLHLAGDLAWTLIERIQHRAPGLPIGVLTGSADPRMLAELAGSRLAFVLGKPYRLAELRQAVAEALGGKGAA